MKTKFGLWYHHWVSVNTATYAWEVQPKNSGPASQILPDLAIQAGTTAYKKAYIKRFQFGTDSLKYYELFSALCCSPSKPPPCRWRKKLSKALPWVRLPPRSEKLHGAAALVIFYSHKVSLASLFHTLQYSLYFRCSFQLKGSNLFKVW